MCAHIRRQKYQSVLVLSTRLTQKVGWHARLLADRRVRYLVLDALPDLIDQRRDFKPLLHQKMGLIDFAQYDCVVLGCTHFNMIGDYIRAKFDIKCSVLDSNRILLSDVMRHNASKID